MIHILVQTNEPIQPATSAGTVLYTYCRHTNIFWGTCFVLGVCNNMHVDEGRPFALPFHFLLCFTETPCTKTTQPLPYTQTQPSSTPSLHFHTNKSPHIKLITHTPPQNVICHFRLVRYVWVVGETALMRVQ